MNTYRIYITTSLFTGLFLMLSAVSFAQDLGKVGKKGGLKVGGGISANQVLYFSDGIANRRDPYNYFLSGNINFSLYGWSVPFSFSYSNQQVSYRQPFNQYGISPTYKWVTSHIGYRSMSFSPYTLSGHIFLGGGVELKPKGKWQFQGMFGRLNKAIEMDSITPLPFYRRLGGGAKITYADKGDQISFIVFAAKDDPNSLSGRPDSLGVIPMENMVWSLGGTKKLLNKLTLTAEFARSALSTDLRAPLDEEREVRTVDEVFFIVPQRVTTVYYNAIKANLTYGFSFMDMGLGYERIDPGYRTLGAYFFNNDLENLTLNLSTSLFKKKLTLAGNFGGQRNNLDETKTSRMNRFVGSVNAGINISQKWSLALNYSSFQSYTNIVPAAVKAAQLTPYDFIDTLDYVQISQNASASFTYRLKATKEVNSNLSLSGTYQRTADKQGENASPATNIYNGSIVYNHLLVKKNVSFNAGFNSNIMDNPLISNNLYGITAGTGKAFFKRKLRTNLNGSFNNSFSEGDLVARIFSLRASGSYVWKKKHNLNANVAYLNRAKVSDGEVPYNTSFNEVTFTMGYSFNF